MMKEKLVELIGQFEPEVQVVVAEVIAKERERLDMLKPHGIKEDIEHIIDRVARYGLDRGSRR
jgi:hypothetical protein